MHVFGGAMDILLDLNLLFIMMIQSSLEILADIWTSLDETFAAPASFFFMVLVLSPAIILKTAYDNTTQ